MRDIDRIPKFLTKFQKVWQDKFPDWRFGQLIVNLQRFYGEDMFYLEEDDFLKVLMEFVRAHRPLTLEEKRAYIKQVDLGNEEYTEKYKAALKEMWQIE